MVEVFERTSVTGVSSLVEIGTEVAVKGGGVAGGLFLGSKLGKFSEGYLAKPVTAASSTTDKVWAGVANNGPKAAVAYGVAKSLDKLPTGIVHDFAVGGVFGLAGDIVVDAIARLTNQGTPTAIVGYDDSKVQALLAENAQLKAAIQKMGSGAPIVRVDAGDIPYGVPIIPRAAEVGAPNIKDVLEKRYAVAKESLAERPVPQEQKWAFADITKPEVLVQAFGFTRGD